MKQIIIHEVGPRDGLQMERQVVPIDTREDWIRRIMNSGVDIVQAGSFVHPSRVPQMADSDELIRRLVHDKTSATTIAGLALNQRGLERGLECGVEMFCLGASASETQPEKYRYGQHGCHAPDHRGGPAGTGGGQEGPGFGAVGFWMRFRGCGC